MSYYLTREQFNNMSFSAIAKWHNYKPLNFFHEVEMFRVPFSYDSYMDWYLTENSPLGQALK